jgi:hypothetical protein
MFRLLILFVLVPVLVTGTIYGSQTEDALQINIINGLVRDTLDYCTRGEKNILIEISTGNVAFSDSLMFFEIVIPIDPAKLRYTGQVNFNGTLGGGSKAVTSTGYDPNSNRIFIEAGNDDLSLIAGNVPLVRIQLVALVDCDDSIFINPKAYFNEEFKKGTLTPFSNTKEMTGSKKIVARPIFKASRFLSTQILSVDTVQVDSNKTTTIPFRVESGVETTIDSIRVYVSMKNYETLTIPNYTIKCKDFELTEIDSFNWFFDYKTTSTNGLLLLSEVQVLTTGSANDSFDLQLRSESLSSCDCVSLTDVVSTKIGHSYKNPMTSVEEKESSNVEVIQSTNQIAFSLKNGNTIKKITMYSIVGEMLFQTLNTSETVTISNLRYPSGLYIFTLENGNKVETIIKYIFNN